MKEKMKLRQMSFQENILFGEHCNGSIPASSAVEDQLVKVNCPELNWGGGDHAYFYAILDTSGDHDVGHMQMIEFDLPFAFIYPPDQNPDDCEDNNCENGSQCQDEVEGYTCICT
eukprot:UN16138